MSDERQVVNDGYQDVWSLSGKVAKMSMRPRFGQWKSLISLKIRGFFLTLFLNQDKVAGANSKKEGKCECSFWAIY
jgi:hypothetical protein